MKKQSLINLSLMLCMGFSSSVAFSAIQLSELSTALKQGHTIIQLGGYWGIQGAQQHINIQDLIGDTFTVKHDNGSNGLVGLGYYIDGQERGPFKMSYGLNAFYLAKTQVDGTVLQENLFENLSYRYDITHYPLYAMAKTTIKTKSPQHAVTLDVGIGPNFMRTSGFKEAPLDKVTIPDTIFSSHTTTTFTATAGAALQFNDAFGHAPLTCGYRFFYLGEGKFNTINNQVVNTLKTGADYANAVICAITI